MIELAILMLVLVTVVVSEVIAHRRDAAARASASRRCRYAALGLGVLGAAATWAVTTDNERTAPRVWAALIPLALCAAPLIVTTVGGSGLVSRLVTATVTWLAFAGLFGVVVIAGLSVGPLYLPADLAILAAAILAGGGANAKAHQRRTPVATAR